LHAWGDSNLYLRRTGDSDQLALAIEHRAAASSVGLALHLLARGDGLALHVDDDSAAASGPSATPSAIDRVEGILAQADAPLSLKALRAAAKMRAATVSDALAALVTQGRARRTDTGYLTVSR
jgi:predicted Rossmann fold nucleotide-binding protein DprA/Smf involved in DNA uptake